MSKVKLTEAAEMTGKSKRTIQRAIGAGQLSYTTDHRTRHRLIDVSELIRVFGNVTLPAENMRISDTDTFTGSEVKELLADLLAEFKEVKAEIKELRADMNNRLEYKPEPVIIQGSLPATSEEPPADNVNPKSKVRAKQAPKPKPEVKAPPKPDIDNLQQDITLDFFSSGFKLS